MSVPDKLARLDPKAPEALKVSFTEAPDEDLQNLIWGEIEGKARTFRKGSVGYYFSGKILNPDNPTARYQVSCSVVLIGSKKAR